MKSKKDFLMSESGVELLRKLFYSSGEGIIYFNEHSEIDALNPRAEEMFGYSESELLGQKMEVLVPESNRDSHINQRDKYLKNPTVRSMGGGLDLVGLNSKGETFPIEISLNYMKYEGKTTVVAFITNISLRKKQEQALEKQRIKLEEYTSELESKVKVRTVELEHLNMGLQSQIQERKLAEVALKKSLEDVKRAEKKILKALEKEKELSELKSRFVSMASHEFRTPLSTIASSANLIDKYPDTEQQEKRAKHVDRINNSVKNLIGILNDFLSMEKLESGTVSIKKSEVNMHEILDETIQEMSLTLKKNQHIECSCREDLVVNTDPHLFKNLLYNLVSNASKYSDEGAEIKVLGKVKGNNLQIEVIDRGIGIPKKEQKNLFTRFFRAGNVTNIQGTGLGLHIVRKYVDILGGEISFRSKEGEGSTFVVRIPIKETSNSN
ncbi:MAG: PAS domain S-box protein [Cytophagales bacterium]|nr:PAS domain S-box protein [Cytophagales bacterium]